MNLLYLKSKTRQSFISSAVLATLASQSIAIPSFPGAEGYGGTFGGTMPTNGWFSNAQVYHVTTTADLLDANSKPVQGTLRGAFWDYTNPSQPKQNASNRVVVFDVGGVFNLTNGSLDVKAVNNIYIAGQTAPSPVTVYGNTTQITHSNSATANTSNVIMRYMSFRRGSATSGNTDSITFSGGGASGIASNMILDHVSASWGTDENISVANYNTNVTVQYSIIADALRNDHAYGSLIRPQIDSNVSFHHNLYANNASRQARFGTYNAETLTADFRNNLIYNWRDRASYTGGSSEADQESSDINYIGNYLVAGPGTIGAANVAFSVDKNVDSRVYQSGNFIDSDKGVNPGGVPNGSDLGWGAFVVSTPVTDQTLTQMGTAFPTAAVTTQTASSAYSQVINYVGNYWWNREAIDSRIIGNVLNGTNPADGVAANAPNSTELSNLLGTATTSRPAGYDTDNDGMPDAWETTVGLNPLVADGTGDFDGDLYTNLEEYLNDTGAFPSPSPITWTGSNSRYALSSNWGNNNWQPSRFDTVNIGGGVTSTVDAPGQHAGTLRVLSSATLAVTNGWINVANNMQIGTANGGASVNQTGGSVLVGGYIQMNDSPSGGFNFTYSLNGGSLYVNRFIPNGPNCFLNLNGGTLLPNADTTIFMPSNLVAKVQAGGAKFDTDGYNITVAAPLIHDTALGATADGGLTKNGSGTLTLAGANSYTGGTTINTGKVIFNQGLKNSGLVTLASGTVMEVAANGGSTGVTKIRSLSLATSGSNYAAKLELHDNDLIIDYSNGIGSPYAATVDQVKKGLVLLGGNGQGIASDRVDAQTLPGTMLAVVDNGQLAGAITELSGYLAPVSSVLVKYTWFGDSNLDGVVDSSDYALIDTGFTASGALTGWVFGDYDYSGTIDGSDYALIDTGLISQSGVLPEPTTFGLFGMGMLHLLRRRRR